MYHYYIAVGLEHVGESGRGHVCQVVEWLRLRQEIAVAGKVFAERISEFAVPMGFLDYNYHFAGLSADAGQYVLAVSAADQGGKRGEAE